MQSKLDHIVKATLAKPSLQEVGREELLMLTQEFPYSPVLQFLYTKRLQQLQDPRFGDSVTRTALFFNNPHWLHQQLREFTAVERVREKEEAQTGISGSGQPLTVQALDTLENEGNPEYTLSISEQALIDSITEAPDGSLIKDEAENLALETLEHESRVDVQVDQASETADPDEPDMIGEYQGPADFSTGEIDTSVDEIDESPEDEAIPDDHTPPDIDQDMIAETPAEELLFQESETPDSVELAEDEQEYLVSAEATNTDTISTDLQTADTFQVETEELPTVDAPEEVEIAEDQTLSPSTDQILESVSEEEIQHPETMGEESLPVASSETLNQPSPNPSSLITVIASVEPPDAHPIHTISLSAETEADNDDDAAFSAGISQFGEKQVSQVQASESENYTSDPASQMAQDMESDNDDDTAMVVHVASVDETDFPLETSVTDDDGELHPSGLEHLGFLPEELLEDSDVATIGSEDEGSVVLDPVETQEGWEESASIPAYGSEDEDHPDATDPGKVLQEDPHGPVINPGDLIRMAGLDMHTETELSFEPLHLTDYFASVGVSLPQEEQPDMFGRQSRSFTGWIRSMKRIHPEKSTTPFTQSESDQIRTVADQSNEQEEVLTETMAGIYAMQGLTHKAIDIYEKLSLLNPEKSAIFAAKLSELKGKLP